MSLRRQVYAMLLLTAGQAALCTAYLVSKAREREDERASIRAALLQAEVNRVRARAELPLSMADETDWQFFWIWLIVTVLGIGSAVIVGLDLFGWWS